MKKEHWLFLVCGFTLGIILGSLVIGPILHARGVVPAPGEAAVFSAPANAPRPPASSEGNPMAQVFEQINALKGRLAQNPRDFEAAVSLGNMYMDARKFDEAIRYYEQALAVKYDANVMTDLGICHRAKGDSARALEIFRGVTKRDPKHFQARFNEAVALFDLERIDEARTIVQQLERERPDDENVKRFVAVLSQLKR